MDELAANLLDYLDEHLFRPILNIEPDTIEEGEQLAFVALQYDIEWQRQSFASCRSGEDVVTAFEQQWHSDEAIEAREGLARLGHPIPPEVRRKFLAYARQLGVELRPPEVPDPERDPELARRIRARAKALWLDAGRPVGRQDEYLERARELEAIADNPQAAQLPNPMIKHPEPGPNPEPVEPIIAVKNQAEFSDPLADQGERIPAPMPDAWKDRT